MLLKLVKLLILAVPVGVFLLGVLQFVKKARHQTKSQTKARLKKARWLRADALLLAALVAEQPPLTAAAAPVLLAVLSVAAPA